MREEENTLFENNQFLKKLIMTIIRDLHSGTKLTGWLRQWLTLVVLMLMMY